MKRTLVVLAILAVVTPAAFLLLPQVPDSVLFLAFTIVAAVSLVWATNPQHR